MQQTVPQRADEDCETTESVQKFGEKLCLKDLVGRLKDSDSESSS